MNIRKSLFCTLYFVCVTSYAIPPNEFGFESFKQIIKENQYIDADGSMWELHRKVGNFELFIDTLNRVKEDPTLRDKYTWDFSAAVVVQVPLHIFMPESGDQTSTEQYYYAGQIIFSDEMDNMDKYEELFGTSSFQIEFVLVRQNLLKVPVPIKGVSAQYFASIAKITK